MEAVYNKIARPTGQMSAATPRTAFADLLNVASVVSGSLWLPSFVCILLIL